MYDSSRKLFGEYAYINAYPNTGCRPLDPAMMTLREWGMRVSTCPDYVVIDVETIGKLQHPILDAVGVRCSDYTVLLRHRTDVVGNFVKDFLDVRQSDLIIGHNYYGFDGAVLRRWVPQSVRQTSVRIGMETKTVQRYVYEGVSRTNILDTYILFQRLDAFGAVRLTSFGLKAIAKQLNLSSRTTAEKIEQETSENKLTYLLEDLEQTEALYQFGTAYIKGLFGLIPVGWDVAYMGNGYLLENWLLPPVLVAHSIPDPPEPKDYEGAHVDLLMAGYIEPVYKIDVVSMYPTIMINYIRPAWDKKGMFPLLVKTLLDSRLKAKEKAKQSAFYFAVQQALKIIVNSFYGFLGANFLLSDVNSAEKITAIGREYIRGLSDTLYGEGKIPIEIDTDGIYFSGKRPTEEDLRRFGGVFTLEMETYDAGVFVKKKNYALRKGDKIILHGNSLKSRSDTTLHVYVVNSILRGFFEKRPQQALQEVLDWIIREGSLYHVNTAPKAWKQVDIHDADMPEKCLTMPTAMRIDNAQKLINVVRRFEAIPLVAGMLKQYTGRNAIRDRIEETYQLELFGG